MDTQKTAIVTGVSQGIGAGLVEAFLRRDYRVLANSRNISKANPFPTTTNLACIDVSVAAVGDARGQPKVADGASELLQNVFGKDPCRLTYEVASLPLGTPSNWKSFSRWPGKGGTAHLVAGHRLR